MEDNRDMQKNYLPKVSIGMPVYNGEKFIRKTLDSLLAQTFTDFELIISDNASTDSTQEICKEYAIKDSRIRYIRQSENKGGLFNFNFVLHQACGKYFMWAAHDDFWDSECVEKYVDILDIHHDVDLVFCNYNVYNHVLGKVTKRAFVCPSMMVNKRNRLIARLINPCPSLLYGMHRTSRLQRVELKHFDFYDIYLSYVVAVHGKIFVLSDFLYYAGIKTIRRNPYSLTGSRMSYKRFYIESIKLILNNFALFDKIGLIALFSRYFIACVINTERSMKS